MADDLVERLRHEIAGWKQAYPLTAFPEPDLKKARAVLREAGMTLDAISASNMRHVVSCLAPLIYDAADEITRLRAELASLRGAVEGERERCARIADEHFPGGEYYDPRGHDELSMASSIAAALRAQPKEGE